MMKMATFMGVRLPLQDSEDAKKISGRSTARKGPIGSTNHPWGMKENPHGWKFHFIRIDNRPIVSIH